MAALFAKSELLPADQLDSARVPLRPVNCTGFPPALDMLSTVSIRPATLLLISILLIAPGCRDSSTTPRLLKMGYIQSLSGLSLFVALDDGFFEEAGYLVETTAYRTSDLAVSALMGGEIDLLGIAGTTQALHVAQDDPELFSIAALYHSRIAFVGRPGGPSNVSEFAGSTIGVFPGSVFRVYVEQLLLKYDVSPSNVEIRSISPSLQIAALEEGSLDALVTLEPTGVFAVQSGAGSYLERRDVFSEDLLGGSPFPGGSMVVSKSLLLTDPEILSNLDSVLARANRRMTAEGFDPTDYIQRHTAIAERFVPHVAADLAVFEDSVVTVELSRFVEALSGWGLLKPGFDLGSILD